MSQNRSLADEKAALLAKMQASRVAYRRMLTGEEPEAETVARLHASSAAFPKSHTVRFIRNHPYLCTLAVLAVAVVSVRKARKAVSATAHNTGVIAASTVRTTTQRTPVGLTLRNAIHKGRTAAATIRRNQNRLRLAMGAATAIARYLQQRRR